MNVKIENRSNSSIALGGSVIEPHRSLTVDYQTFINLVITNDLTARDDIKVIKERYVPTEISVTEFGVKGNGIEEDTYCFQKAIDFLELNGGGVMRVPAGVYPIKTAIIKSPIQIDGSGSKNTIIKALENGVLFDFIDCGDVSVSNIKVDTQTEGEGTAFSVKVSSGKSTSEQQLSLFNVSCKTGTFKNSIYLDNYSHIVGGFATDR